MTVCFDSDQRHRKDTDNRLREKHSIQKQLNEAQQQAEMDKQNKKINQRIEVRTKCGVLQLE